MTSRRGCALGLCARWWIAVATEALKSGALWARPGAASLPVRRPPIRERAVSDRGWKFQACRHRGRIRTGSVGHERPHIGSKVALAGTVLARIPPEARTPLAPTSLRTDDHCWSGKQTPGLARETFYGLPTAAGPVAGFF
jgi:hypothetical protein